MQGNFYDYDWLGKSTDMKRNNQCAERQVICQDRSLLWNITNIIHLGTSIVHRDTY